MLPPLSRPWFGLALAGIVLSVGARVPHYVPFELPSLVERVLSRILHYQIWGLLVAYMALPAILIVAGVVGVLLLFRRRWCFGRVEDRWAARPWLLSLMWAVLLLFNFVLDMDPRISLMCWMSLPALFPALWGWLDTDARWPTWVAAGALWAAFFGLCIAASGEPMERVIIAVWAAFIVPATTFLNRRSLLRDRLWLALVVAGVVQFVLSELPRDFPNHGGTQIGRKDYAYTFCENAAEHKLFAAVPCDGFKKGCTQGYVAEHDTRDLSRPAVEHRFFSPSFQGRLVHLVCLDDTVQVGMARSQVDGRLHGENVMEFRAKDPRQFRKSLFAGFGPRIAYDRRHDAVFYISEFSKRIFRFDRRTGTLDDTVADAIYGPGGGAFGSHIVESTSFHEGRDSVFFVQWLSGSRIFELDRSTLRLKASYDAHHGGSHGVAIDDELDRIWVTGIWGVDVLEVGTGRLLSRSRLGLGCRLPVIDRRHDIVYVPNTAGRLWAIDRRRFAVLGSLLLGGGSRNPYVSSDGTRLFASAEHGYFYWDTAKLAERFR